MTATKTSRPYCALSLEPAACYSKPVRIPVGLGFVAELPLDDGTITTRWNRAADWIRELVTAKGRGPCLQYWRLDNNPYGWIEIQTPDQVLPATTLLTHPQLARLLREEVEMICDGIVAFYVKGDRIQACPLALAAHRKDWHGPIDLRTGYCVTFDFI